MDARADRAPGGGVEVVRGGVIAERARRGWLGALWRAVEVEWLDMTSAPLAERLFAAGWRADAPTAYCARCGLTILDGDRVGEGCDQCAGRRPAWERIVRLGEYRAPLSNVVREIKFSKWRRLGFDLGRLMGAELAAAAGAHAPGAPIVLVPVPMSRLHRLARGMDHALAICRGVREGLRERGMKVEIRGLLRRRHGPSQLSVLPSERAGNVGRRIYAGRLKGFCQVPQGALVVVVDDVMTTGATMQGSCRGLREGLRGAERADCRVWGLVAARTELVDGDREEGQ